MMTCRNCQQELPDEAFELYSTGTRRRICRQCHYQCHTRQAYLRWSLRQKAHVLMTK